MSNAIRTRQAASKSNKRLWLIALLIFAAAAACLAVYRYVVHRQAPRAEALSAAVNSNDSAGAFEPTIPNTAAPPAKSPSVMAWIPGGEFSMGAQVMPGMNNVGMQATLDSRPIHRVYVYGFFMDRTDVTNAQFEQFVNATG